MYEYKVVDHIKLVPIKAKDFEDEINKIANEDEWELMHIVGYGGQLVLFSVWRKKK